MRRPAAFLLVSLFTSGVATAANIAGPDQFICGTFTVLEATALQTGESGFWMVVQGSGNFSTSNSPASSVSGLAFGENILRWTLLSSSGTTSDLVSIWAYNSTSPQANAGPDQTVNAWPGTAQLSGSIPSAPATCFWSVVSGTGVISDPNDPLAQASAIGEGTNGFQWTCDNGPCGTSSDQMAINAVVGIEEANASRIELYYDASAHRMFFSPGSAPMSITLFDQQGRGAGQHTAQASGGTWDLPALPVGVYAVQFCMKEGCVVRRFMVSY